MDRENSKCKKCDNDKFYLFETLGGRIVMCTKCRKMINLDF